MAFITPPEELIMSFGEGEEYIYSLDRPSQADAVEAEEEDNTPMPRVIMKNRPVYREPEYMRVIYGDVVCHTALPKQDGDEPMLEPIRVVLIEDSGFVALNVSLEIMSLTWVVISEEVIRLFTSSSTTTAAWKYGRRLLDSRHN